VLFLLNFTFGVRFA